MLLGPFSPRARLPMSRGELDGRFRDVEGHPLGRDKWATIGNRILRIRCSIALCSTRDGFTTAVGAQLGHEPLAEPPPSDDGRGNMCND